MDDCLIDENDFTFSDMAFDDPPRMPDDGIRDAANHGSNKHGDINFK